MSVFAAEVFPEVRSFRSEVTSLVRLVVSSVVELADCCAAKSVLSLARSDFAPETSPEAKALSSVTMSCVTASSELLVLVLVAAVDDVLTAAVALVVEVLVVFFARASSAFSKSEVDEDETADTDMIGAPFRVVGTGLTSYRHLCGRISTDSQFIFEQAKKPLNKSMS